MANKLANQLPTLATPILTSDVVLIVRDGINISTTTVANILLNAPVQSVSGKTGTVSLVKADVGLSNVDNTADLLKPISTATQSALDAIKTPATNLISTSRALLLSDASGYIIADHATIAITLVVENDSTLLSTGNTTFKVYQLGAAPATFQAGAGVTILGTSPTPTQYKSITLLRISANTWGYA